VAEAALVVVVVGDELAEVAGAKDAGAAVGLGAIVEPRPQRIAPVDAPGPAGEHHLGGPVARLHGAGVVQVADDAGILDHQLEVPPLAGVDVEDGAAAIAAQELLPAGVAPGLIAIGLALGPGGRAVHGLLLRGGLAATGNGEDGKSQQGSQGGGTGQGETSRTSLASTLW